MGVVLAEQCNVMQQIFGLIGWVVEIFPPVIEAASLNIQIFAQQFYRITSG